MVGPFAFYFGIREWEMGQLTHHGFLEYERYARELMKGGRTDG